MSDQQIDEMCTEALRLLGREVPLSELREVYAELVRYGIRRTPQAIAYRYNRGLGVRDE